MTGRERLKATLAGDRPDRLPLCLWHHFRPAESPAWLADATLHFFGKLGFDIIKVMPDLPYPAPAGGALRSAADWRRLQALRSGPGGD
ncbi:MAG: uroporphyrinogen decarboxylase, partial [Chloroflexota bacterium]|nr:uroporphyrinogen decarboxylase [Chloroflexota bacterium]